jgi:hypothetical protein
VLWEVYVTEKGLIKAKSRREDGYYGSVLG